jgi:sn-1 stearoyl-lipid 9-desaturase
MNSYKYRVQYPLNLITLLGFLFLAFNTQFLTLNNFLTLIAGWSLIAGLGVGIGLHRVFSHKTHTLKYPMKLVVLFFATLSCEGPSIWWAALHRGSHHRHADTDKDPQSPIHGFYHSLIRWKSNITLSPMQFRFVPDLIKDRDHIFFQKHYLTIINITWVVTALVSLELFFFGLLLPAFLSVWLDSIENIVAHTRKLGYRNYNIPDNSTNVWWMTFIGWGSGALHNNHHNNPSKFSYRDKWWEIDLGTVFLPVLWITGSKRR